MFLQTFKIDHSSLVSDIVTHDYRTAAVFRKYAIECYCGGKWSLEAACEMRGLDVGHIQEELEQSMRNICLSNAIDFREWNIDFLIDYIVNIHHQYLKKTTTSFIRQKYLGCFWV